MLTPEVQALVESLLGPLQAALDALPNLIRPLWTELIAIMISATALLAIRGTGDLVNRMISMILTGVLAMVPVTYASDIVGWSVASAGDLAGLAGAGHAASTPYEVASQGMSLFTRLTDHADTMTSYLNPVSWLIGLFMVLAAFVIAAAYFFLTLFIVSAHVEILACALLLFPMFVFTMIIGFGPASFAGIGFMLSAVLRLAAFGFVATAGTALVDEFVIPPIGEPIEWIDIGMATLLGLALLWFSLRMNGMVSGLLMGRPGWASPVYDVASAISRSGRAIANYASGGGSGAHSGSSGGGGGGGGRGAAGSGAGITGAVSTRTTPGNSRQAS